MAYAKAVALCLLAIGILFAAIDVTPASLSVDPPPLTGMRSVIKTVIQNTGADAAGQFMVCLNIDGRQYAALPVEKLAAGAKTEVSAFWWPQQHNLGKRSVQVVLDCTRKLSESNKGNNEKSIPITVNEGTSEGKESSINYDRRSQSISNNLLMAITTTPQGLLAFIGVCATAVLIFVFLSRRQE
jgi:hypothetical protein